MTCTASYKITEADATAGQVKNVAIGNGKDPDTGREVPPGTGKDNVLVPPARRAGGPDQRVVKKADKVTAKVGETITYSYIVANTGSVPLKNVTVTDDKVSPVRCPQRELTVGAVMVCTGTYTVRASDMPAVANLATVHSETPDGKKVPPKRDNHKVPVPDPNQVPGLTLEKQASHESAKVGETVTYSYIVVNSSAETIKDITVSDDKVSSVRCPRRELAVRQTMICTGRYTVTEADKARGYAPNNAVAKGKDPRGKDVTPGQDNDLVNVPPVKGPIPSPTPAPPGPTTGGTTTGPTTGGTIVGPTTGRTTTGPTAGGLTNGPTTVGPTTGGMTTGGATGGVVGGRTSGGGYSSGGWWMDGGVMPFHYDWGPMHGHAGPGPDYGDGGGGKRPMPFTGAPIAMLALASLLLVAGGGLLVHRSRRRARTE
jgi:hypothetical protein